MKYDYGTPEATAAAKEMTPGQVNTLKSFKTKLEKKLTPAELKKREEIAKAMEKDNPDMPMDQKMAIATAQAKKVAEETVNEAAPPIVTGNIKKAIDSLSDVLTSLSSAGGRHASRGTKTKLNKQSSILKQVQGELKSIHSAALNEEVDEEVKESRYGTQAQRLMSPLQKARQDKEKSDRDRDGKLKSTALPMRGKKEEVEEEVKFTDKQIKMAYGIVNDPRWKGGNMSSIVRRIEGIAKGLSNHPGVKAAIKRTNESTAAYGKSMEKQRDDEKKRSIRAGDKSKLSAIAQMMQRERERQKQARAGRNEGENHSWRTTGHYTKDGEEWTGDQHAHDGQVMTGKTHTDDSVNLYHFKDLSKDVQQKILKKHGIKSETKGAPKGYHFTRDGELKKGDAGQDGPGGAKLRSDPLDKQRSKIPPLPEATAAQARRDAMRDIGKRKGIDPADRDDFKANKDDQKRANLNPIMQLRRAADLNGNMNIEFQDGKKKKLTPVIIKKLLTMHDSLAKTSDKENFTKLVGRSYGDAVRVASMNLKSPNPKMTMISRY